MITESRPEFSQARNRFLRKHYKTPVRFILSYLGEYKFLFILSLVLGVIQSALFLMLPLFLGVILDVLVNPTELITKTFPLFLLLIIIIIIVAIIFGIREYINRWIGANVIYHLRNDVFSTIQLMSFYWLSRHKTGDLLSRNTSDINLLQNFLSNGLQDFIRQSFTFFFSFLILFIINFELAIYIILVSPALFFTLYQFRKRMWPVFKKSRETYADLTHEIQENVQGIKIVKSFRNEDYEIHQFSKINNEYYGDSMNIIKIQATFDPIIRLIDNIGFLLVILIGGLLVSGGRMNFGELFSFILVMNFSIEPLFFVARFLGNTLVTVRETCARIENILTSESDLEESTNPVMNSTIKGDVSFDKVDFKYNPQDKHFILEDINIKINAGETIAILGPTGSGKSTLIKLIPRFYDVSEGKILIDGKDVKKYKFESLRKQIGYVSQERVLFSRSIKDNIRFGNNDLSDEEVKQAAKIAHIHKFIEKELPKGYDTEVGERGVTLSGGQRQRVAIARAIAIKPRILLLDDCFSSVDVDTEYEIQKKLKSFIKNITTILITQRLSTVRHADKILVLENGKVSQFGTHEELITQKEGIYRKLYSTLKVEERHGG
ncbi:MAG: ABC transporter ATP-binding protein [Promethearchaeota archaeon]|nr:MAG: ABC transporter ATP-binding protein [Candidatus Lokiarchaeota archaeon]